MAGDCAPTDVRSVSPREARWGGSRPARRPKAAHRPGDSVPPLVDGGLRPPTRPSAYLVSCELRPRVWWGVVRSGPVPKRSPLLPIFLIVLVDIFGLTIIIPLLSIYSEHFGATPLQATLLVSVYALCQLVSAPLLGKASDRFGRKPLLLASQMGTFLGFLLLARATTLWMVYLSRVIDGATAGNISLAQAYISDNTEAKDRTKSFALIGIAFGLGFFVGPLRDRVSRSLRALGPDLRGGGHVARERPLHAPSSSSRRTPAAVRRGRGGRPRGQAPRDLRVEGICAVFHAPRVKWPARAVFLLRPLLLDLYVGVRALRGAEVHLGGPPRHTPRDQLPDRDTSDSSASFCKGFSSAGSSSASANRRSCRRGSFHSSSATSFSGRAAISRPCFSSRRFHPSATVFCAPR